MVNYLAGGTILELEGFKIGASDLNRASAVDYSKNICRNMVVFLLVFKVLSVMLFVMVKL